MKLKRLNILILGSIVFLNGCAKTDAPLPPTLMQITFVDTQQKPVAGLTVNIYRYLADMNAGINSVAKPQVTDWRGVVTFAVTDAGPYCWIAKNGCSCNNVSPEYHKDLGASSWDGEAPNTTNYFTSVMQDAGSIQYVNTSTDIYQITFNGEYGFRMGQGSFTTFYTPTGVDTIRTYKVGTGGMASPASETVTNTFITTVSCGSSTTLSFP